MEPKLQTLLTVASAYDQITRALRLTVKNAMIGATDRKNVKNITFPLMALIDLDILATELDLNIEAALRNDPATAYIPELPFVPDSPSA
jgi:hypothetical protein